MSKHLAILFPLVLVGCSRSASDVGRIKELEERHVKLEKEHQAALTESKKVAARLTLLERELGEQVAESKKISTDRENLTVELKKTTRDRDDLGKTLSLRTEELVARTKELVATIGDLKTRTRERDDLRIDLSTRTKERDLAYQDLHQFTSEMQSLVSRMEASLQTNQKKTTSAPSFYPPTSVPTPPVPAPPILRRARRRGRAPPMRDRKINAAPPGPAPIRGGEGLSECALGTAA